jgi:hypothetical protein
VGVDGTGITGSSTGDEPVRSARDRTPVASTGCIVGLVLAVLAVFVIAPALIWGLGMACGAR